MNLLTLIFIFFTVFVNHALSLNTKDVLNHRLTRCLGREELKIHKKNNKFLYELNQTLTNKVSGLSGVTLSDQVFNRVCSKKTQSPSVNLLSHLMKNFEKSFIFIASKSNNHTQSLVNALIKDLPQIFNVLILQIKESHPPQCLRKYAPEIAKLDEYRLYLGQNMSFKKIIKKNKGIFNLFNKIKDPKYFKKKCRL